KTAITVRGELAWAVRARERLRAFAPDRLRRYWTVAQRSRTRRWRPSIGHDRDLRLICRRVLSDCRPVESPGVWQHEGLADARQGDARATKPHRCQKVRSRR